jgi:C-terminal processing protease CtpA/Prc
MDSTFHWEKNKHNVADSIMNEWKKGATVVTKMLKDNIGYLRIPSIMGGGFEEFSSKAQKLNDSLCMLLSKSPKGLIIDLRLNGGGAMHPMILGVQNLLPSGKVGEFLINKKKEDWILSDNGFIVDTSVLAKIVPRCTVDAQRIPIVILTSPQTASSGEFLLMTFKGRPNTIQLGTSTRGLVTVNTGFSLKDTAFINLAVGYGADRNGKAYTRAIDPEIYVNGPDNFNNLEKDLKVVTAIKWLEDKN